MLVDALKRCPNRNHISINLNSRLNGFCLDSDTVIKPSNYREFEGITQVISKAKLNQSLKLLVGCVNQSPTDLGMSAAHFPAQLALLEFGERAIPEIENGLNSNKDEIKCPLLFILAEIGGGPARDILFSYSRTEKNDNLLRCARRALEVLK